MKWCFWAGLDTLGKVEDQKTGANGEHSWVLDVRAVLVKVDDKVQIIDNIEIEDRLTLIKIRMLRGEPRWRPE